MKTLHTPETEHLGSYSWQCIRNYSLSMLEYTRINTIKIAREFATECTTQAYTLVEVVRESIRLEKEWERIISLLDREEHIKFAYFLKESLLNLEVNKFPILVFCSGYKIKADNSQRSWQNYVVNTHSQTLSKTLLMSTTNMPLKTVGVLGNLDDLVLRYLGKLDMGKRLIPRCQLKHPPQ